MDQSHLVGEQDVDRGRPVHHPGERPDTSYSQADLAVVAVDPGTDTLTVQQRQPTAWGPLLASTPILFGPTAAQYGLKPNTPYYLVSDGTTTDNAT